MKMIMEQWNDNDREKGIKKCPSHCRVLHLKSHVAWPSIESELLL
jgi:hypothetical protein